MGMGNPKLGAGPGYTCIFSKKVGTHVLKHSCRITKLNVFDPLYLPKPLPPTFAIRGLGPTNGLVAAGAAAFSLGF